MKIAKGFEDFVSLDTQKSLWEQFHTVAPLVVIGTKEEDGFDLAPKHMVTPIGFSNYFGFVCSDTHHTYTNIERSGQFTVSYTRPSQVLYASLAASPRYAGGRKTVLQSFTTFPAKKIKGEFIAEAYLFLECVHHKTIDGFGENCLITGEVVAAYAHPDFIRSSELDDQELIHQAPLLAYLPPGRFSTITRSNAFPFPADMKR